MNRSRFPKTLPNRLRPEVRRLSFWLMTRNRFEILSRVISRIWWYRVHLAGSGEEALEIYRQHPGKIDLVILDLGMVGMGGHKCLEEILAINSQAKVIIASGYTTDDQGGRTLSAGAAAFVGKPFKMSELQETVRSLLDKR